MSLRSEVSPAHQCYCLALQAATGSAPSRSPGIAPQPPSCQAEVQYCTCNLPTTEIVARALQENDLRSRGSEVIVTAQASSTQKPCGAQGENEALSLNSGPILYTVKWANTGTGRAT